MSGVVSTLPAARLGGLLRDLTAGLRQQMVFWGRDVVHPAGNLLLAQGFSKAQSAGLQGTSCYGLPWQGGRIELHGACAGWYAADGGFVFIRPHGKCFLWRGGDSPVPGEWPALMLEASDVHQLAARCRPFLEWWLHSERWIVETHGASYRDACHLHVKRLPKGRPWLPPAAAVKWVAAFLDDPAATPRAKRFDG